MNRDNISQPNSIKIMDKLKQIKRIFNDGESIYASNPTALQSQHQNSLDEEHSRLKKYLPESMRRQSKEEEAISYYPIGETRYNDHNNFKKQLQSKIQTLFNEQKSLLRNRYDMDDDQQYSRRRKGEYARVQKGNQKQSISAMDKKVRELEKRYLIGKQVKEKSNKDKDKDKQKDTPKKKNKDNKVSISSSEVNDLKQALYQTKLLNQKLSNKLLKQKQRRSQTKDAQIQKLSHQIITLKQEMSKLKSVQQSPYVVCPARVKARHKSIYSFITNQKTAQHSILTEVYGQIEDLQSRLTRQQKQRLDLHQKNTWLQSQLQKFTN